jgi:hypothetical protein
MRYTFLKADLEMPLKAVMRSLYEQEVIRKLHLWPLNEPYFVWVDIGETHDDGIILSEKLFSLPLKMVMHPRWSTMFDSSCATSGTAISRSAMCIRSWAMLCDC